MDEEVKQEWVQALRSGDYEQGTGQLRTKNNKYCCLGVLCDIAKDRIKGRWEKKDEWDNRQYFDVFEGEQRLETLPDLIVDKFNLPGNEVEVGKTCLTNLNDGVGCDQHSFDEIADAIEQHL